MTPFHLFFRDSATQPNQPAPSDDCMACGFPLAMASPSANDA